MRSYPCRRHHLCSLLTALLLSLSVAQADIAVVVNPQNPLSSLTPQELKKIFLGRMSLYPDSGREIRAIDLPDTDPLFAAFYRQVVELDGTELKRYRAYYLFSGRGRLPAVANSPAEVLRKVMDDPAAIGYIDTRDITDGAKVILILSQPPTGDASPAGSHP